MSKNLVSLFAAVALSASLAACGGGGGGDSQSGGQIAQAPAPVASAPVQAPPPPPVAARVSIPDTGLRTALVASGIAVDAQGTIDGTVAAATTQLLIEQDYGIVDLTGLSAFTHLTKLHVYNNATLTNVADVSGLTSLTELGIYTGTFSSIDVSKLTRLQTLGVTSIVGLNTVDTSTLVGLTELDLQNSCDDFTSPWGNSQGLTSVDLSHNTNLQLLHLDCNLLTSIDTSHNAALTEAWVSGNQRITSLDFSSNHQLSYAVAYNMASLTTLNVKGTNGGQLLSRLAVWSDPNLATIRVDVPSLYTMWMSGAYTTVETQNDGTQDTVYSQNANFAAGSIQFWISQGASFTN